MSFNLTLLAQMLAFAAFILFTVKVVWPHMLRAIETRQKTIADGLAAAEQGHKTLEASKHQADDVIHQARERSGEILGQAEKRASQMVEDAKQAARQETEREKSAAKAEIQQELARAREQLRDEVAALAIAGAERILRREVDAKAHAALLDEIKKQL